MNTSKFIDDLSNRVKEIGEAHDAINSGGCACMAVMLADALENKVSNIEIKAACGRCDIDKVRLKLSNSNNKDEWNDAGIFVHHIWVEFTYNEMRYAIDSTGIHDACMASDLYDRWSAPSKGSFYIEEMRALADDERGWNSWFDRSQLPSMQQMTNELIATI